VDGPRIYGPDGKGLAKPLAEDEEGILYGEIDLSQILYAKAAADPVGHYSRPDVLSLTFDPRNHTPVRYVGADGRANFNTRSRIENYRLRQLSQQQRLELSAYPHIQAIPLEDEGSQPIAALGAPRAEVA
jgi:hypothetical protein